MPTTDEKWRLTRETVGDGRLSVVMPLYMLAAEAAEAGADVLLAASVFHFHVIGIPELKAFLAARKLPVRL